MKIIRQITVKNIFSICCIVLLLCSSHIVHSQPETQRNASLIKFYVSNIGNDQWTGSLPAPNSNGNDGPFETLQNARDIIRNLRRDGSIDQFTILVRGGIYELTETLTLGPEDSGSELHPFTIRAYENERPVLRGTRPISNFKPFKGRILQVDLKGTPLAASNIRQLFADGKRQTRARFPNIDQRDPIRTGFLYVESSVAEASKAKFRYLAGDDRDWAKADNAEIVIYPGPNYWSNIIPVGKIDKSHRIITLMRNASYPIEPGNRYFFQNLLDELDSPGEWFFDRKEEVLYYWPANETAQKTVSVPVLKSLLEINERTYFNKFKATPANIRIEGFTLEGCEGSTVVTRGAKNIVIGGCTIYNAGGHGIELQDGHDNAAIGNDIYEVGGAGIIVTGGDRKTLVPGENRAENNYIHHVGVFDKSMSGIDCRGVGNVVAHNLIHSTPRIGIWFDGNDHIIEYNHVHHVNQETQDSGVIYSCARDWTKRGNIVRHNYVHNSGGYGRHNSKEPWQSPCYTWGIYLDDFTSGTEVYGNIVENTDQGGIFIHGGRDNIIENNIIIEGGKGQMVYSSIPPTADEVPEMMVRLKELKYTKYPLLSTISDAKQGTKMSGNKFLRNIIYYLDKRSLLYDIHGNLDLATTTSDYNIIFHAGLPILVPDTKAPADNQWAKWRENGLDKHSIVADPLLYDSGSGKYQHSPAPPALKLGIKPIPFEKIGPYNDPLRASWPITEPSLPTALRQRK